MEALGVGRRKKELQRGRQIARHGCYQEKLWGEWEGQLTRGENRECSTEEEAGEINNTKDVWKSPYKLLHIYIIRKYCICVLVIPVGVAMLPPNHGFI